MNMEVSFIVICSRICSGYPLPPKGGSIVGGSRWKNGSRELIIQSDHIQVQLQGFFCIVYLYFFQSFVTPCALKVVHYHFHQWEINDR